MELTKIDQFLAYTINILEKRLEKLKLTELEEIGFKISVYHIFESNYDLEKILYELLDYFEEQYELSDLLPELERCYLTKINK